MWSHYAQNHQGFCVEYDLEALPPDHPFRRGLYPVIYSRQLYDLTPYAEKLVAQDREKVNPLWPILGVIHKFDGWKYEEEWRFVSIGPNVSADQNWRVPTPVHVFLGSKMEAAKIEELLAICEQKGIKVSQMQLANDRFELLPKRLNQ